MHYLDNGRRGRAIHRHQSTSAEISCRYDQGQAGPLPPELARQAGRLLGPFGHRGGPDLEIAPVRPAEENGAGTVQAVHLQQAAAAWRVDNRSRLRSGWLSEKDRRSGIFSKKSFREHPVSAEPGADAAPPRHSGFSSRCWSKVRRYSCTRWSVLRSTRTSTATRWRCTCRYRLKRSWKLARADDVFQQYSVARER